MSNVYYGPSGNILGSGLVMPQGGQPVDCLAKLKDGRTVMIVSQHGHGPGKEITYKDRQNNELKLSELDYFI